MKIKTALFAALGVLFAAKYSQIAYYSKMIGSEIPNALLFLSFLIILSLSFLLLKERWRMGNIVISAVGIAILAANIYYPNPGVFFLYEIMLVTSLFLLLYPFHHYEIKKFPAFGYAFMVIYILLESTSMWWNQYNITVFTIYLTLSLIMFIPGILKIKD